MEKKTVFVVCPYPLDTAPGQRFRFEQYLGYWARHGIRVTVAPFWDASAYAQLYSPGRAFAKPFLLLRGFIRRLSVLAKAVSADYVFLYREATPIGPPWFEATLFWLRRRVVFDFDDAIFVPTGDGTSSRLLTALKFPRKAAYTARRAWKVSVSTPYLAAWAGARNPQCVVVPTTLDPKYFTRLKSHVRDKRPVIGWSGSRTTSRYLELVRPVLAELQKHHDFEFVVICNEDPGFPEQRCYRFIRWNPASEVDDLMNLNIGLMPQPDVPFARGKAGLKAMQYSALGIVPVVSPIGGGDHVVHDGETGFVVGDNFEQWYRALDHLLRNPGSWEDIGQRARERVFTLFSSEKNATRYLNLFADCSNGSKYRNTVRTRDIAQNPVEGGSNL
jgi:glycosyltransferase involved in cell wall biosynthesis